MEFNDLPLAIALDSVSPIDKMLERVNNAIKLANMLQCDMIMKNLHNNMVFMAFENACNFIEKVLVESEILYQNMSCEVLHYET